MLYKIEWTLLSPIDTMLQSDTIFGHLCWALNDLSGREELERFLKAMEKPVLSLSSGFPAASLPMPQLPLPSIDLGKDLAETIARLQSIKEAKKTKWIPMDIWKAKCNDFIQLSIIEQTNEINRYIEANDENKAPAKNPSTELLFHNMIDRNTGTTTAEGANLYSEETQFYPPGTIFDSYLDTEYFDLDTLKKLFEAIEASGFGKNKSSGKGQFRIQVNPVTLCEAEQPNAWLLLSNMVPAAMDPPAAYYNSIVKFGKLGGSYAVGNKNPFKKPLLLFTPGSVFLGSEAPRGSLVHHVHPDDDTIVQHGYAMCIGFHLSGGKNA